MDKEQFANTWQEISKERYALLSRRTDLENELIEIRKQISHLDEVLNHLAPLAGIDLVTEDDEISQFGLTDAIRFVLRRSETRLSAQEIRRLLTEKGYDLSALSAPMASVYKILSRLSEDSGEVEREKEEGRVYYKWKETPISEEDIPF